MKTLIDFRFEALNKFATSLTYVVNSLLEVAKIDGLTIQDSKGGTKIIDLSEPLNCFIVPTSKNPTSLKSFMKLDSKDIINNASVVKVYLNSEAWINATNEGIANANTVLGATLVDASLKVILDSHNIPYVSKDGKNNATIEKLNKFVGLHVSDRRSITIKATPKLKKLLENPKMIKALNEIRTTLIPKPIEITSKSSPEPKYKLICTDVECSFNSSKALKPFPQSEYLEVLEHFNKCGNDHKISAVSVDEKQDEQLAKAS